MFPVKISVRIRLALIVPEAVIFCATNNPVSGKVISSLLYNILDVLGLNAS